jgi:hypothetical protein
MTRPSTLRITMAMAYAKSPRVPGPRLEAEAG